MEIKFDKETIDNAPIKWMSPKSFLRKIKRAAPEKQFNEKKILNMDHGEHAGCILGKDGIFYVIRIKRIYIKPYTLKYSTHTSDRHEGKEILISNFPLPKGPVMKKI